MTQDDRLDRIIDALERRNGTKLWPTVLTIRRLSPFPSHPPRAPLRRYPLAS